MAWASVRFDHKCLNTFQSLYFYWSKEAESVLLLLSESVFTRVSELLLEERMCWLLSPLPAGRKGNIRYIGDISVCDGPNDPENRHPLREHILQVIWRLHNYTLREPLGNIVIHLTLFKTFHKKAKTCQAAPEKVTTVRRIHPLGIMSVCTKPHGKQEQFKLLQSNSSITIVFKYPVYIMFFPHLHPNCHFTEMDLMTNWSSVDSVTCPDKTWKNPNESDTQMGLLHMFP